MSSRQSTDYDDALIENFVEIAEARDVINAEYDRLRNELFARHPGDSVLEGETHRLTISTSKRICTHQGALAKMLDRFGLTIPTRTFKTRRIIVRSR